MAYIDREALKTELQKKIELSHNARRAVIEEDFWLTVGSNKFLLTDEILILWFPSVFSPTDLVLHST